MRSKLEPEPRDWDVLPFAGPWDEEVEIEEDGVAALDGPLGDDHTPPGFSEEEDESDYQGSYQILTPDEVAQQELAESETDTAGEATDTDSEDPFGGIPTGMLYERFIYVTECLTCDGDITLVFLATVDGAGVFGNLIESSRVNLICSSCLSEDSAAPSPQPQPGQEGPAPEPTPEAQQPTAAAETVPEDKDGGQ